MAGTKKLLVVESPTKARTIGKYLGKDFTIRATVGHVRDLPQRELGVDVERGFRPTYVTIRGKGKTLAELKKAAKEVGTVLIGTDPDREGEAIAWHVAKELGGNAPVRRVLFHEITPDAVRAAVEHPVEIDERKVEAQQARRILDRLVGYRVSPLLWKAIKSGLSAGRVQTVALRLIVEREGAIVAFTPQEYWTIAAQCEHGGQRFEASLHKLEGKKPEIGTEEEARRIVAAVRDLPFVVTDVRRKERRKRPAPPYTTSTLQQEAAKRLGFTSRRTMRIAQELYEGVEIGEEGPVGLITYMRTDSTRVAPPAIEAVREFISANFDRPYLPAAPNLYAARQPQAQDAHEAVRPTDVGRRPEAARRHLSSDQFKLYRLIWQRFVASQMAPAVYDTTTVDFDLGRFLFRATGSVVVFDGYHRLYQESREAGEGRTLDDLPPIPALKVGDRVTVLGVEPAQHFTEPPPRYSEASLIKELERLGIGRPSTYTQIVSTLQQRHYVEVREKRFHPTELGSTVARLMVSRFPNIFNVEFTRDMESELDKVEDGSLGWQRVLGAFYDPFARALAAVKPEELISEAHNLEGLDEQRCPRCGSPLGVKSGRWGPFIACTTYPTCRYTKALTRPRAPDRPSDEVCTECGAAMVIKTGRYGEFLACTRYPACKGSRPLPLGVKCPKCGAGDLAERRTRKRGGRGGRGGRKFYGCSRYPDCDYSLWSRPVPVPCPGCGFVGAEVRERKGQAGRRRCLKCGAEAVVEGEAEVEEPVPG